MTVMGAADGGCTGQDGDGGRAVGWTYATCAQRLHAAVASRQGGVGTLAMRGGFQLVGHGQLLCALVVHQAPSWWLGRLDGASGTRAPFGRRYLVHML